MPSRGADWTCVQFKVGTSRCSCLHEQPKELNFALNAGFCFLHRSTGLAGRRQSLAMAVNGRQPLPLPASMPLAAQVKTA